MCLIRSIDSNMADLGLHITLLPIIGQALPRSAATCQNQLLVLQIGLCLFLYVFPVFEHLSVLFCSVLLFLAGGGGGGAAPRASLCLKGLTANAGPVDSVPQPREKKVLNILLAGMPFSF